MDMIREAERADRDQLYKLYRMLVPNSKKMNVLEEQIDTIKQDPHNFLFVFDSGGELTGTVTQIFVFRRCMGQDRMRLSRTLLFMRIIEVNVLVNNFYNMLRTIADQ
ncbi:hypothetical protein D3C75_884750 [compost metagenome]